MLEIERKFLIKEKNSLPPLQNGIKILQGYLHNDPAIRFRIINNTVILTIKKPMKKGYLVRYEYESEKKNVSNDEINFLISCAKGYLIEKTRYKLLYKGQIWEIDIFERENKGLIIAEAELPSEESELILPPWIDKNNEVTNNEAFLNVNLAKKPFNKF